MNYAVETGLDAMIYIPSFRYSKVNTGDIHTDTVSHTQQAYFFYQKNENRLK
jgi:hypothetical protein